MSYTLDSITGSVCALESANFALFEVEHPHNSLPAALCNSINELFAVALPLVLANAIDLQHGVLIRWTTSNHVSQASVGEHDIWGLAHLICDSFAHSSKTLEQPFIHGIIACVMLFVSHGSGKSCVWVSRFSAACAMLDFIMKIRRCQSRRPGSKDDDWHSTRSDRQQVIDRHLIQYIAHSSF